MELKWSMEPVSWRWKGEMQQRRGGDGVPSGGDGSSGNGGGTVEGEMERW